MHFSKFWRLGYPSANACIFAVSWGPQSLFINGPLTWLFYEAPNSVYKVSIPWPKHLLKGSNCSSIAPGLRFQQVTGRSSPVTPQPLLGLICGELREQEWFLTPVSLTLTESMQLTHLRTDGNHSFEKLIACRFNIETSFFNLPLRKKDRKQGIYSLKI